MNDKHVWFFKHDWLYSIGRYVGSSGAAFDVTGKDYVNLPARAPLGIQSPRLTTVAATVTKRFPHNRIHLRCTLFGRQRQIEIEYLPRDVMQVFVQGDQQRRRSNSHSPPKYQARQIGSLTLLPCCVQTLDRIALVIKLEYQISIMELANTASGFATNSGAQFAAATGQALAEKMSGVQSPTARLLTEMNKAAISHEALHHQGQPVAHFWQAYGRAWGLAI